MANSVLPFAQSEPHTLGVEMELQLIHPGTLDLNPVAPQIIQRWADRDSHVKPELLQSMIEVNTGVCRDAHEVDRDLRATLDVLVALARDAGARLASNGTHATARHWERLLYPSPRYQDLIDRNQFIARRLMIFGLHVHVGARDGHHCIWMSNGFLHYLPHLLALSASSPFWEGQDTGLASSRITVFEALPTGGHPCAVATWDDFQSLVRKLVRSRAIRDLKDIWWDIRPSPKFGTIEIRVCDGLPTVSETVALTALIHCLAISFDEHIAAGLQPPMLPDWLIRENKWRASRHGLDADLVVDNEGNSRPLRDELNDMLDRLSPIAETLGYERYFDLIRGPMMSRPPYLRQRDVFRSTGNLTQVTASVIAEFEEDLQSAARMDRGA